jgi:hypothetical protein
MNIFVVNGCIDDTMRGISFTLGIFDSFKLAHNEMIKFIEKLDFEKTVEKCESENSYFISSFKNEISRFLILKLIFILE